jgi:Ca-activated chloride channel homolog
MHKPYNYCCSAIILICLFLAASDFGGAIVLSPQMQQASSDRMIKLNVLVTDSQNRPVGDVKQEEFRVLEDGIPKTISYFSKDELPLDYCIVLDTSGSVKKSSDQMINAAQIIVINNKPGDEMSLIEFKDAPELSQEFTSNQDLLLKELNLLRGGASRQSAIIDAVYLAVQYVAEYKPVGRLSRRALIVISDGDDCCSYYKPDDLRKLLRKENVQVFVIGYDLNEVTKTRGKKKQQRAIELLSEIAKETGGQAYFPQANVELQEIASKVLQTLRAQYVIGYKSTLESKKGTYHNLSVSVIDVAGRDKRVAIARTGYIGDGK